MLRFLRESQNQEKYTSKTKANVTMIFFSNSWFHKHDYFYWPIFSKKQIFPSTFPSRMPSEDVSEFVDNARFVHICWRNPWRKTLKFSKISWMKFVFSMALYDIHRLLVSHSFICNFLATQGYSGSNDSKPVFK